MSGLRLELLQHICDECRYLLEDSNAIDEERFMRDETRKRAYARSFEIIGEASKQVNPSVKEKFSEIEWTAMARMRDRLIHHYFGVDYSLVWNTVREDVPRVYAEVGDALAALQEDEAE